MNDSCYSLKASRGRGKSQLSVITKVVPMLDQFHLTCHPHIEDVIDMKADDIVDIATLLGMGEESWALVRMNLFKELCQ